MLIRNVCLPDGRQGQDLLVQAGRIQALGPQLPAPEGVEVLDGQGYLLSPPFVDAHFHLDAALSYGQPRVNQSGTLLEGIALWGELKPLLTQEALGCCKKWAQSHAFSIWVDCPCLTMPRTTILRCRSCANSRSGQGAWSGPHQNAMVR